MQNVRLVNPSFHRKTIEMAPLPYFVWRQHPGAVTIYRSTQVCKHAMPDVSANANSQKCAGKAWFEIYNPLGLGLHIFALLPLNCSVSGMISLNTLRKAQSIAATLHNQQHFLLHDFLILHRNVLLLYSELKFVCTVFVCKFELMGVVSVCKGVFFCGNLLILCSEVVPLEGMQEVGQDLDVWVFGQGLLQMGAE
jgi:hypothetical protein